MRTVFLGSPPFAVPVLRALLDSQHEVAALVTPPDRPRGRGRSIVASPLVEMAQACGVPVLQPKTTKDDAFVAALQRLEPDVLSVASYGELLRTNVLELAPHGALNVHGSLLPRWRGASPVQAAILAGDAETGVSIQRMVLALDAGDVLLEKRVPIGAQETAGELTERLAQLGGQALVEALDLLDSGQAQFHPQDEAQITLCRKIQKDAGRLDFTRPASELARLVRAMNPWPGAFAFLPDGRRLVVLRASAHPHTADHAAATHGSLLPGKALLVACGDGVLELETVKPQGKSSMDGSAFLRGSRFPEGTQLGSHEPSKNDQ